MNVENGNVAAALGGDAGAAGNEVVQIETISNEDSDLGAIWDKMERDNGAERGADGRFASSNTGDEPQAQDNGDGEPAPKELSREGEGQGEAGDDGSSTLTASSVPLPANWNGMDEDWKKIPGDVQTKIAAREQEIHARMSDQGRQISAYKPLHDIFEQNKDLWQGKIQPDGRPLTSQFAMSYLLDAQRRIETNPIGSLIEIAESYGLQDHLKAALNGQTQFQRNQAPAAKQQNALTAADVLEIVKTTVTQDTSARAAQEEVNRLSADKPFYSEIAEEDMVHAIHRARAKLGDAASNEAVFDAAYDMAVHADPALRAKVAAAAKKDGGAAAAQDRKRTEDAKRANSINVSSTSSGKGRDLTEDELLSSVYDGLQSKG